MVDQQANPRDWSLEEVDHDAIDYFTMLRQELFGEKYSKAEHRRTLISQLDGRSKGAIEQGSRLLKLLGIQQDSEEELVIPAGAEALPLE